MTSRIAPVELRKHLSARVVDNDRLYRAFWRVLDVVCSLCALLLLAPVLVLLAALTFADGGRPVLFSQRRIGRGGVPFTLWKFRTMRSSCGRRITACGDRRVTMVGAWLRKLKLDELPQLFNILKGDMSLVGPRPEIPEYVSPSNALWRSTLAVKPGLTDLASLVFRNEEDILARADDPEEYYSRTILPLKLLLNLHYMQSRCWRLDVTLIVLTACYSFVPWTFNPRRIEKIFYPGVNVFEPNFLHPIPRAFDR